MSKRNIECGLSWYIEEFLNSTHTSLSEILKAVFAVPEEKALDDKARKRTLTDFFAKPKDTIISNLSPRFRELVEPYVENPGITADEYKSLFPEYEDKEIFVFAEKSDESFAICRQIVWIYYELFIGLSPLPSPVEPPSNGIISFSDEIEESIPLVREAIRYRSNSKGHTVQTHLLAEDFGFDKDQILVEAMKTSVILNSNANIQDIAENWFSHPDHTPVFLLDWLKPVSTYGYYGNYRQGPTLSLSQYYKQAIRELITGLECGKWYNADDLWEYYSASYAPIVFRNDIKETWALFPYFRLFANSSFTIGYHYGDNRESANQCRTMELIQRPVFRMMLYILAMLGILDITERTPELALRKSARKFIPYSPADCIDAVSLTQFGLWVLGIAKDKPESKQEYSEPILDKDLLLITYKGKNPLYRNLFASIAHPLGTVRYRVTQESFAKAAPYEWYLDKIIAEFEKIFTAIPENWQRFFESVRDSYNIMPQIDTGYLLKIRNRKAVEEIMKDDKIKAHIRRVEDDCLFITAEGMRKVRPLIVKKGYNTPFDRKY